MHRPRFLELFLILLASNTTAWSPTHHIAVRPAALHHRGTTRGVSIPTTLHHRNPRSDPAPSSSLNIFSTLSATTLCSGLIWLATSTIAPPPALAANDAYASSTVKTAVTQLRDAQGNADATVKAYENIAEIITEGKGVGGAINYQGIQLDRGYIADEDTTLYNPGLTLLTESEKNQLVQAIVESKAASVKVVDAWNVDTDAGFQFLVEKLDPLHMYELKGYLSIVPIYGAVVYLAVLAVQQMARDFFPVAYIVGALAVFAPAVILVLLGPT